MCNTYFEKLGFFVLRIDPKAPKETKFMIKWKNKLDCADSQIYILRDRQSGLKELILAFKIIYVNMYSLFSLDISVDDTEMIIFRHESF